MTTAWRNLIGGALLAGSRQCIFACGYCNEDKIASVYDHAAATRPISRKHQVAFLALEADIPAREGSPRTFEAIVESVAGVEKGSVRDCDEPASISAAFNPARAPVAGMQRPAEPKARRQGTIRRHSERHGHTGGVEAGRRALTIIVHDSHP